MVPTATILLHSFPTDMASSHLLYYIQIQLELPDSYSNRYYSSMFTMKCQLRHVATITPTTESSHYGRTDTLVGMGTVVDHHHHQNQKDVTRHPPPDDDDRHHIDGIDPNTTTLNDLSPTTTRPITTANNVPGDHDSHQHDTVPIQEWDDCTDLDSAAAPIPLVSSSSSSPSPPQKQQDPPPDPQHPYEPPSTTTSYTFEDRTVVLDTITRSYRYPYRSLIVTCIMNMFYTLPYIWNWSPSSFMWLSPLSYPRKHHHKQIWESQIITDTILHDYNISQHPSYPLVRFIVNVITKFVVVSIFRVSLSLSQLAYLYIIFCLIRIQW
jgi:hypothetical protein